MSIEMSNPLENNDAFHVLNHGGYDLSNQLETLLNGTPDSSIVKLSKTHCKELQLQNFSPHKSKKEEETNAHKNFYRLINETKPCDVSKDNLANESFHKPKEPVRFGRRAVPLGIDAEYDNVIHFTNESSLEHERWSTTQSPTKEDINRSYQLNVDLSLSDSKDRVANNNNNSKTTIDVERVTAGDKDSLSAEHVERRRTRRPKITSVTISPLHHTLQHGSTTKEEVEMSQTYSKPITGDGKNTGTQSMKLPFIASNNAGVTSTSSTKGAFATHKINKIANRTRPSVDLLLNNATTKKANSSHLTPIITTKNNNTNVGNQNKNVISNNNNNFNNDNDLNSVNIPTTSLSHATQNTVKARYNTDLPIDNTAGEAEAATKTISELYGVYDLLHLLGDDHDNNSIDEQKVDLNKDTNSIDHRYEVEREKREAVPAGKVCAEIAKFNAKRTEDTDTNIDTVSINNNKSENNKFTGGNSRVYVENGVRDSAQQSLKEHSADVKINKAHTGNLACNTHTTASTSSSTTADAITNIAAAASINNTTTNINIKNKDMCKEYNHTLTVVHNSNEKKANPELHDNGLKDDIEDKRGLTTARYSAERKSNNVDPTLLSLPLKNTTHSVNVCKTNELNKDKPMELLESKKPPVLNRESVFRNEKNTSKNVDGDNTPTAAVAANVTTTKETESKRHNTDKHYSPIQKENAEEPTVGSKLSSRRVLMNATDTASLFTQHSQKDAASERARLMAWQDVCLFTSNLPWEPVKVNDLQTRKRDSKEDTKTRINYFSNNHYTNVAAGGIGNECINISNNVMNGRKSLITCHQRYPAMYGVDADGTRSGWVEIAGEAVEMDARLHNILAQLHHYNRPDQTEYPAQLPMTVDLVQHRRRPHTPRSFYGPLGPILGASWFKGALDNTTTIVSPNLSSLEQKEEMEKMTGRGLVDHRKMCEPVNNVNKNGNYNIIFKQNLNTNAIDAKHPNNNVNTVARVTNPSKPTNTRNPYVDMAITNTIQRETS